jgi:biopolymer transport protein ExbD
MIDMVFLLLVFFLVSAKPIKPETDVGMNLPGTVPQEEALEMPDEMRIEIQPAGDVAVNDVVVDKAGSKELPQLVAMLVRFRQANEANKTDPLVTIDAAKTSLHQRIIDVLNACAKASVTGVTFATDDEEEGEL